MTPKTIIRRFNLFKDQTEQHVHLQNIIYYAESRFWAILVNLAKADRERLSWCQRLLHRELVGV